MFKTFHGELEPDVYFAVRVLAVYKLPVGRFV